jgi:glycosyltransferase involved in cell wall biosynthesis
MKDKGLVGCFLAREIGSKSVMFYGDINGEYDYLSYLPETEIQFSDITSGEIYLEHLNKYHSEMDILILHGMYEQTIYYLYEYRKLRPDSRVYCGLDMNSYWMNNIIWDSLPALNFSKNCDLIATSCRFLRDELNRSPKVSFPCRWFPNGFYNPTDIQIVADYKQKKNVIVTVGRIGTNQKNNLELMLAFAKVSNLIPDWSLRLVGTIEPEFQYTINKYFSEFSDLTERVIFVGEVSDKKDLYSEYANAKIFALTSKLEGGTPNVYAEALFHGCMFITSDIDAADDITDFGRLGIKYKFNDIDELASAILKMCSQSDENAFRKHIPKALEYANKYYDWNRNAKKLAYMISKCKA